MPQEGGWDIDAEADDWGASATDGGGCGIPLTSEANSISRDEAAPLVETAGLADSRATGHASDKAQASVDLPAAGGKPLVAPPEFEDPPKDKVRDTDKEPYWIPGE